MPIRKHTADQSSLSTAPAQRATVVTPSDSVEQIYRSLWVGGLGAINVRFLGDTGNTLISGVPAGTLLPFAVKLVLSTNTDATLIVGLE